MPNGEQKIKPWNEIAAGFDPMMPAEQYDTLRLKYFNDFVKPKVAKGRDVGATWTEFKNLTDRASLLGPGGKALLHSKLALASAAHEMVAPLKDLNPTMKSVFEGTQRTQVQLERMGAREGMDTRVPRAVGAMGGQVIDFAVLSEVLGPLAGGLANQMNMSARGVELTSRVLRGGLAFGTYDALSAESENRLQAGLKGFAIGAGFDLALGGPKYLVSKGVAKNEAEANEILKNIAMGQPKTATADVEAATKIQHDAKVSRRELRPEKGFNAYTLGKRGARVYVRDISDQITPIEISPKREYEAYRQIRSLVEQGGSVVHYEVHPDEQGVLNEFIRIQTNAEEAKYRGTILRTAPGDAPKVAEDAKKEGIPTAVLSKDTVEAATVNVQHPILNKPKVGEVKVPERKPSHVELTQALDKRKLDDKAKMFLERQFERIWDPNLEWEDKRSAVVMMSREIPEMLPEAYRAKLPPFDIHGNLVREVVESRVLNAADRSLGYRPSIDHIGKGNRGQAVVTLTTHLTEQERLQLQNALGPEYEIYLPKRVRNRAAEARLLTDEEINEMLDFHNVKPEDVDVEAIREGGQAELIRQLEVKMPEHYGKKTSVPKAQFFADKIPPNEQQTFSSVREGIRSGGQTSPNVEGAVDDAGLGRFLVNPAGTKAVEDQLQEASLEGRLMGSIEDVPPEKVSLAGQYLGSKGFSVVPINGYKPGQFELVYTRKKDIFNVAPLINDYDQFVSREAGRVFDSNGRAVTDIGEMAHRRLGKAFGVPEKEIDAFIETGRSLPSGRGVRPAPEIAKKPYGNRMVLQQEDLEQLYPGAVGLAHPNIEEFSRELGIELPPSVKGGEPLVVLTPETPKDVVWHERFHANRMYAGTYDDFHELIPLDDRKTALEIAKGLEDSFNLYSKAGKPKMVEEAFTHAAQAVRFGDKPYLEHIARWDTDVEHVLDFVHNTSLVELNKLLERLPAGDPPQVRIFQRTLLDLARRSSRDVSESLREGVHSTGSGIASWFDSTNDMWVIKEGYGREAHFKDIHDLWDFIMERDKNFMSPSMSLRAELGGVKGPIVPQGRAPDGSSPPTPEIPPEGKYVGMSAASALWRPFFPWLASLHENMNALWKKSGKYLPLYETAKAVDDQFRAGDKWLLDQGEKIQSLLSPFKGAKMRSVFDYLTYPEAERTTKLMGKYGLSQGEAIQAHKVWEYMKQFRKETEINLPQYMLEYHPKLRGFGWDPARVWGPIGTPQLANTFDKLVRHEGKWDPQDAHIGRFLHTMIREGMEKKFTGTALNDFEKLISQKTAEGTYLIPNPVRWPMENYVKYMRGIPDTSQQVINKTLSEFFVNVNEKIKALNQHLPKGAKLPEMTAPPRQFLNRFMLMSYAMGLGMRPAIALRDGMQAFTGGMTVMGPGRFLRAFGRFMANPSAGLKLAEDAGALLRKNNMGELWGDILSETPTAGAGWMDRITRWSNTLLSPSRWGHNFGRAITYFGEYHDTLEAIKQYRAGRITVDQLMEDTTMWFMDKPAASMLLKYAGDVYVPVEDAARKIALEAVDLTQWPYRRGTQPTLLRYGIGRIFGQYGVWPANFADFLYRIGRKFGERPKMAARTAAMWAAVNYSLSSAMEAVGADTSKWFWQSPAGFAGSPHWDFIHAVMVAPENTEEGHAARRTILEYPLSFVPAMAEMKAVAKALQEGGNEWPPNQAEVLRVLGFKPLEDVQKDKDWEDLVKTQLGYESARRRR